MLYSVWKINDEKEYKLRLSTGALVELERKLGASPLAILQKVSEDKELPTVDLIMTIVHASLQKFQHGLKLEDVYDIYDEFVDEGNGFADLIQVLLDCFAVSGLTKTEKQKN